MDFVTSDLASFVKRGSVITETDFSSGHGRVNERNLRGSGFHRTIGNDILHSDMKKQSRLQKAYTTYKKKKPTKSSVLQAFRAAMPEIIFHTTKLEGEPVTRKMVNSLFK